MDQHQQKTWHPKSSLPVETLHWTLFNMDSVPLHSFSILWSCDFQTRCKLYFGPLSNSLVFFLLSPALRLSLVQDMICLCISEGVSDCLLDICQLSSPPHDPD
ncbi:hypothetical protein ATANTOWER_018061 [Ataeniobius toweri]|uniref:Uncharacterized protein n=1 Tax=Ataeniobius toweri TaxID=208326 RepID=A0ABU7B7A2_9TELE|nr:hypothetical protein [Ataeniobius toweri]